MIDLDELERLEREATPGPWGLWEGHLYIFAGPAEENDPGHLKGTRVTICDATFPIRDGEYRMAAERGHAVGTPESDFNLIVAARNALPDLIAELRTLRARVAELERAKNEEIAVLREALRRVLGHYLREARQGDGIDEDAWDDVAASMVLAKAEGPRFEESAIKRGLSSIHEAAKVER